ncbi:MAG TPA: hypothetical protein VJW93_09545 [Candidatus Acidoferrales bacterium]|nr:hypothetical protein [Candidatus Acidoferrales bacterium]
MSMLQVGFSRSESGIRTVRTIPAESTTKPKISLAMTRVSKAWAAELLCGKRPRSLAARLPFAERAECGSTGFRFASAGFRFRFPFR